MQTEAEHKIKPVCPLTGSAETRFICHAVDTACSGETFEIWEDTASGIRFTHPAPGPDEIGRYYEFDAYLSHGTEHAGITGKLYASVRNMMLSRKYRMLNPLPSVSESSSFRMLDIGCGDGTFAGYCAQKNPDWEIFGVEPSASAAETAKQRVGNLQLYTSAQDVPADKPFHLVTAWHALEHIHDLNDMMRHVHNLLEPNGIFCVALPNFRSRDCERYKNSWAAYDVPRHLWHFSPEAFTAFARKHGFTLLRKHRLPFDPFYVSLLSEPSERSFIRRGFSAGFAATASTISSLADIDRSSSVTYVLKKSF